MPKWCVVPNCKTGSRTTAKRSLFRVPKDAATWKKWEVAIPGILKLNQHDVVCELHFTEKDISREWIKIDANGKVIARAAYKHPQLQKFAVPSIFGRVSPGIKNCVPMHEYAKPFPDFQIYYPMVSNQCNVTVETSSFKTPEIQESSTFMDVPLSTSGTDIDICEEKPPPIKVLDELPAAETFVPKKPDKLPLPIETSKRVPKENAVVNRDFSAYVPEGWCWGNMRTEIVQWTLFTYAVTKLENDVRCPIVQKAVTLDMDGRFQYFVYGRHVNSPGKNLEQTLSNEDALKNVLVKFKGMNICSGIGDISINFLQPDTAYQDHVDKWRSKACSLISPKKRCESCMKTRKCILQRVARLKNPLTPNSVGNISNPVDLRKLSALRIKLRRERRQKIRAQNRVKHLTECIKCYRQEY